MLRFTLKLVVYSFLLIGLSLHAVVNSTVPDGNLVAPTGLGDQPSDPGFNYVGQVNGSSAVYLGDGWVLTANHVGAGDLTLGGTTYRFDAGESYQIGGADLRLFKISSGPAFAPLKLSTRAPVKDDYTVMIGAGRTPQSTSRTLYFVDTSDPQNSVWDTSPFSGYDTVYAGFPTSSETAARWGTNLVDSVVQDMSYDSYTATDLIVTDFDAYVQTPYEAQAVTNDSGGGLFIEREAGWELAGTIVSVGHYNNQPGGAGAALYGNLTYAIDLSQHASEIASRTGPLSLVPEPRSFVLIQSFFALWFCLGRRTRRYARS
jgi:hypothetical protein